MSHSPMMGCFDPWCLQCACAEPQQHANCRCKIPESTYVRYHEIGNSWLKAIPRKTHNGPASDWKPMVASDLAGTSFDRVIMDEVTKAFAIPPAELGLAEKSNLSQGSSMSTIACLYGPDCPVCNAARAAKENDMSPYTIRVDLSDVISKNSTNPTPEQSFLSEVEARAKDNPDMARLIKEAAERAEKARNERIQKALDGSADLELLKGAQGKLFVLKHFYRGKERTVYGVAYPGYDASEEEAKKPEENTVFFQADKDPVVYTKYMTMGDVKRTLESYKSPYVIKFFD